MLIWGISSNRGDAFLDVVSVGRWYADPAVSWSAEFCRLARCFGYFAVSIENPGR